VPSVNIEYSDEEAKKIKDLKGYVSQWVEKMGRVNPSTRIEWQATPPERIRCFKTFTDQIWVPWDEYLE
jgi:alpha-1,3-mannosyltransferase